MVYLSVCQSPYTTHEITGHRGDPTRFEIIRGEGEAVYIAELETNNAALAPSPGLAHVYQEIYRDDAAAAITATEGLIHVIIVQVSQGVDLASFNHWYDEVHVPAVAGAGLLRARRYRSVQNPRVFMAMYELEFPEALESQAMLQVRGFGRFERDVGVRDRLRIRRDPVDRVSDTTDNRPRQADS